MANSATKGKENGESPLSSSVVQHADTKDAIEAINHDSIEAEVAVSGTNIIVLWLFLLCIGVLLYQIYSNKKPSTSKIKIQSSSSSSSSPPSQQEVEMRTLDASTDW
mmetsp:Transcript_14567/g.16588  ORF Transcript_14567/g.16588 Transcript_14567/m.16588 type:complete len:107 (-) Transcript_14567:205-525(-)